MNFQKQELNIFRLVLLIETPELIEKINRIIYRCIENDFVADAKSLEVFEDMDTTLGHLYKGVE